MAGAQESVVPDAVKARGQDVEQEAADEFERGEGGGPAVPASWMVNTRVAEAVPLALVAEMVAPAEPGTDGVPAITPVVASTCRPGGRPRAWKEVCPGGLARRIMPSINA